MALREFLEKRFPRLLSSRESSLYANATTTCKVCGAPLRGDEVKCPYCGTVVREGEVTYAKVKESKVKIVKNIIKRHFPGRYVSEIIVDEDCQWRIECQKLKLEVGRRKMLGLIHACFEVTGIITDTVWEEMKVSSYHPNYDSGAEAVAEELKSYTDVILFLSGGK